MQKPINSSMMNIMKKLFAKQKTMSREDIPRELDIHFYKKWYADLSPLSEQRLVRHWLNEGKLEKRHSSFATMLEHEGIELTALPIDFKPGVYSKLNPDVGLPPNDEYRATYHFLKYGHREGRQYRFDHDFYVTLNKDLQSLNHIDDSIRHWLHHGKNEGRFPTLTDLLAAYGVAAHMMPADLEILAALNPDEHFTDIVDATVKLVEQNPVRKMRVHADNAINANFYVQLALHQERAHNIRKAKDLFHISILFNETHQAHESLGNFAINEGRFELALRHYRRALVNQSQSEWVSINLAHALQKLGNHAEAIDAVIGALAPQVNSTRLLANLDQILIDYWAHQEQSFTYFASSNLREPLMDYAETTTRTISNAYSRFFRKFSSGAIKAPINDSRVLIIGAFGLPQCVRYRIMQKKEQLVSAGYNVETVDYLHSQESLQLINNFDIIIFYRVPAGPTTIKTIEYARALGKITFYDIDDLLIDPVNPPIIESYGGQVPPEAYINLIKDTSLFRAAATLCDYAISSTKPLLQKLSSLVRTGKGFLHRNALDTHILNVTKDVRNTGYVSIFYGSGTLAHNSDFIDEALPAIKKILSRHANVKLVTVGHLKLPTEFTETHRHQLIQLPIIKNPENYLSLLSSADINIAVLHNDTINDCKSEIKWMEAGFFGIPSVVSPTKNYLDVVNDGVDGYIASTTDQWYACLDQLINNTSLREKVGSAARTRILDEYAPKSLSNNISRFINSAIDDFRKA